MNLKRRILVPSGFGHVQLCGALEHLQTNRLRRLKGRKDRAFQRYRNTHLSSRDLIMFVFHLDLGVKEDGGAAFEPFYRDVFHPAIAKQPGFSQTQLLTDTAPKEQTHRLVIVFESEALQKKA